MFSLPREMVRWNGCSVTPAMWLLAFQSGPARTGPGLGDIHPCILLWYYACIKDSAFLVGGTWKCDWCHALLSWVRRCLWFCSWNAMVCCAFLYFGVSICTSVTAELCLHLCLHMIGRYLQRLGGQTVVLLFILLKNGNMIFLGISRAKALLGRPTVYARVGFLGQPMVSDYSPRLHVLTWEQEISFDGMSIIQDFVS